MRAIRPTHMILLHLIILIISRRAQIMKLLIMQFTPASCHILLLGSKNSPIWVFKMNIFMKGSPSQLSGLNCYTVLFLVITRMYKQRQFTVMIYLWVSVVSRLYMSWIVWCHISVTVTYKCLRGHCTILALSQLVSRGSCTHQNGHQCYSAWQTTCEIDSFTASLLQY
jgi:hypothetical protein